mgnify:CR=1 FL=1
MTKKNTTNWAEEVSTQNKSTANNASMKLVTDKEKEETRRLNCHIPAVLYQEIMAYQYDELKKSGKKPSINSIVIEALEGKVK